MGFKKSILALVGVAVLAAGVFMVERTPPAGKLTVTKTVYLEDGANVGPAAIVRTHDNGFIIAGEIQEKFPHNEPNAWAIKVNNEGKVIWQYVSPMHDNASVALGWGSSYGSVAIMLDDSIFLCGSVSGSALLAHLD